MDELKAQKEFLELYNIKEEDFAKTDLSWDSLRDIYTDYQIRVDELDRAALPLFNTLIKIEKVHSVRYRIKSPEHVVEKIIRKKIKDPRRVINKENYFKQLTDLIGLRAIHLFKDDWQYIHEAITDIWNLQEKPVHYYREGDHTESEEFYRQIGCKKAKHPRHYRSVHYVIKTNPTKREYFAEIQVRTIFEEGWSEIDHKISYPYSVDNKLQNNLLSILNRLAGSADEMGMFINELRTFQLLIDEVRHNDKESGPKDNIPEDENLTSPKKGQTTIPYSVVNNQLNTLSEQFALYLASMQRLSDLKVSIPTFPTLDAVKLLRRNHTSTANRTTKLIKRSQFKEWPFTVEEGLLKCENNKITFKANGVIYGVNGLGITHAKKLGGKDVKEIVAVDEVATAKLIEEGISPEYATKYMSIGEVLELGKTLCK